MSALASFAAQIENKNKICRLRFPLKFSLLALVFGDYGRQSHQNNGQSNDSPDKINDEHAIHTYILADNQPCFR
ncbi:hypothetical protein A3G55_03130 [Candidatus Giovannonibacteria bacterium RIFCSPLOWO2_12_FULL_44_25]|uniref:Uncharacterized protein n=1 Tax=Candidatus Giovannonibacteria bacterium RIFCSPHIGHO2_02_FULL_45_40 TaxID=1798337 RepID=A0A1F5W7Q3_9BACT|nr:MAG: hypothetical protein A2120_00190 [Candidatus Giovannonibacteria bacterium GWA2_45_15]OGF59574.1 MAG: hypothetical protein A2W40_02840 [Candidatus Giovannonibacteria bacterium RIFCSPHIGHO2_01_45_12]OGF61221.1 MAG: hypothetical protein A2656_04565 [Candidatus Giovannonibacteria bacterium RIFCSPHIGHO2_01_FULL_44_100]OGF71580.1 MAG: hypothetical protein A3C05_01075 [Candidatus Giovannonibacteria bacterium RIFCSPHIGHO2_02_FULL_45_40]OGF83556.1 MAG: hypothetical protein A3E63_03255 [Candidatu